MALLTHQYKSNAPIAALAEYSLARLLYRRIYAAALELNQRLAAHLKSAGMSLREVREVAPLMEHADSVDVEIAELCVLAGKFPQAIAAYDGLVDKHPGEFELRSQTSAFAADARQARSGDGRGGIRRRSFPRQLPVDRASQRCLPRRRPNRGAIVC